MQRNTDLARVRAARLPVTLFLLLAALCLACAAALAEDADSQQPGVRAAAVQVSAVITAIDQDTRELTLRMPHGDYVTIVASPDIQRFGEFAVGDAIVATYVTSLGGEVRKPTPEELETPWQELDAAAVAGMDIPPGVAGMRVIKAVCTIEGMNRVAGTAMIEDPRGKYHLIGDIAPERFEGVQLGDTVVMVYTQALALTLEKAVAE